MKKLISVMLIAMMLMVSVGASAAFEPMQKGSKGDAVKELQALLIEHEWLSGKADGDFGGGTEKAVKAFQTSVGLDATGIVDEDTYDALNGWFGCEHTFGDYETVIEPTCAADGESKALCTVCGKPDYQVIESTGHNLVQSPNFSAKVCTLCGLMEGEVAVGSVVSAEDHAFEIKDVYYTTKVSEKTGSVTYSMQEGSYMVVKLAFTNQSTEAFECWHSNRVEEMNLTYDGKFVYEGETWTIDDIVPLDTKNLYIVYTVPEVLKDNADKSVVAEFTIDDEYYVVNIVKGAIEMTGEASAEAPAAAAASLDGQIAIGDTRTDGENFDFTVKEIYYTTKVSEKTGSVTYSMQEGSYMVVKLAFTNLSAQAFERWHSERVSDMTLTYADKYEYEGETWTIDDIVPLDTKNLYIVYTVPEMLKDNTDKPMTATFTIDGQAFTIDLADAKIKN